MNSLRRLVELFLRDMLHRRYIFLLIVPTVLFGLYLVVYFLAMNQQEQEALGTQEMCEGLNYLADQTRQIIMLLAMVAAASVAPASRKNGTLQFVLSLGASRLKMALAQFLALTVFLFSFVLVLQVCFYIAGFGAGCLTLFELLTGWTLLWLPIVIGGLAVFSLSLTRNAMESLGIYLGIHYLLLALHAIGYYTKDRFPAWLMTLTENALLLFPNYHDFIFWPHFPGHDALRARLGEHPALIGVHLVLAAAFWIVLGLYLYHRGNFGTRTETK